MSVHKAVTCGLAGNEISKQITGSSDKSPERTIVATGLGAAIGATASTGLAVISAPVSLPLTVASATIAGLASLFD